MLWQFFSLKLIFKARKICLLESIFFAKQELIRLQDFVYKTFLWLYSLVAPSPIFLAIDQIIISENNAFNRSGRQNALMFKSV